jgi:hypothetical protein
MLADVVFPAAAIAYVANLFVPLSLVLAMATEYGVYIYFQRGIISLWKLLFIVLGVNAFSWFVGAVLSSMIPDRFIPQLPVIGGFIPFAWACFLSTVLEFFPLWLFRRRLAFRKLGLCVVIANVAGYIVIGITVFLCEHFQILMSR